MAKGGFNLRKWNSNSLKLQKLIAGAKNLVLEDNNSELVVSAHTDWEKAKLIKLWEYYGMAKLVHFCSMLMN